MAYDHSTNDSLLLKFDADLKGSVDFDFFGANTPRDIGSNNSALEETVVDPKSKCTVLLNSPNQPPNSPESSLKCDNENEFSNPRDASTENYDSSSDSSKGSSSYCSSLSKSESLPQSDDEEEISNHPHRSDSTNCSASSFSRSDDEDDFRPRSPSPTPRDNIEPSYSRVSKVPPKIDKKKSKSFKSSHAQKSLSQNASPIRSSSSTNISESAKTTSLSTSTLNTSNWCSQSRNCTNTYSSSSSSDVTDVSPLSSNGSNSPVSFSSTNRTKTVDDESSMISSDYPAGNDDRLSVNVIMRALMQFEHDKDQPRPTSQAGCYLKNHSFSTQRCRDIDVENQRLLNSLIGNKTTKPATTIENSSNSRPASSKSKQLVYKRPYHSALNRQKQQRKIEEENRRIHQRINSVRATPGLVKQNQFRDYMKVASMGGSNVQDFNSSRLSNNSQRTQTQRPQSSVSMRPSSATTRRSKEPIITDRTKASGLRRCRSATSLDRFEETSLTSPTTVMSTQTTANPKTKSKPITAWGAKSPAEPSRSASSLGHPPASPSHSSRKSSRSKWPAGW